MRRLPQLGNSRKAFLEHFNTWPKEEPEFKPNQLVLANVERTSWQVDTRNLPSGFRRSCGRVLQAAEDMRRLAALAVQRLTRNVTTHIDPTSTLPGNAFYARQLGHQTFSRKRAVLGLLGANRCAS